MSDLQAGSNAAINTPAKSSAAHAAGVRIEKAHLAYKQCGDILLAADNSCNRLPAQAMVHHDF